MVDRVGFVEQANEGADGAGSIVVLRLAEKQGGPALDVAQVDIVAECRAFRTTIRRDSQHDFRLRIVPARDRVEADICARSDRGQCLRLGENLRVRADADLEVL
ncbi:hypothetical protein D9M72_618060 [compost metagenome]